MIGQKPRQLIARLFPAIAAFWFMVMPTNAQDIDMPDQRPELLYSINIDAKNMFVKLYINDAYLLFHGRFSEMLFTLGIDDYLKPGTNRIVIDYEPFDMEKQTFTPHEGVILQVKLDRQSNQKFDIAEDGKITVFRPEIAEEVHLFSGRYDVKTGQMQQTQESVFNQGPLVRRDGGLVVPGTFTTEPVTIFYGDGVSDGHAQRLIFTFDINDVPMPTPPWVNAPPLTDTPELRAELLQAYQQMHRIIAARDEKAYRKAMHLVFAHAALTRGYHDAEDFANALFKKRPFVDTPDKRVSPLLPAASITTSRLDFGQDQQRMVRFLPNPIRYETENGDPSGSFGLFFCRQPEGHLAACYIKGIPYR